MPDLIPFPAVEPTSFAFVMPRHPVTSAVSESGVQDHRLWGTVAVDGALELEFRNIRTEVATSILQTFHDSYSGLLPLELPDILFAGETTTDRAFINSVTTEAGLQWFWPLGQGAPNPRKSLTYKNRCTLPVRLEARLENTPQPLPPAPIAWISRLLTAIRAPITNGGPLGGIATNTNGDSFQVFWFEAVGGSAVRVVVVKRSKAGDVLWTRWTSGEFGSTVTSRDARCPQVLPLLDGGCIVFACAETIVTQQTSTSGHTYRSRAWRINSDGSQQWSREYVGPFTGAYRVALNNNSALVYCSATFIGSGSVTRLRPALLVIDIASGSYVVGSGYQLNGTASDLFASRRDALLVDSGSVVLKASQDLLLRLNSFGTSVLQAAILTNLEGGITALPSGSFACRNGAETLVILDPTFTVTNSYRHINAMQASGTLLGSKGFGISASSDGTIYHMGDTFGSGLFFNAGVKIAVFSSAATPLGYGEIGLGSGIGGAGESLDNGGVDFIDVTNKRGLMHIAGSEANGASCRVHALGFDLALPTATAANTTPARTLDTGGCGNTLSLRGWDAVGYTSATPPSITRSIPTIAISSVLAAESVGGLDMVEASSLFWQNVQLTS